MKVKKCILVSYIMIFIIFLCVDKAYADNNFDTREKESFEDIGENYFKKVKPEDIVIVEKNGIAYVKNQLLISALVGTDKKAIEDIVKEINADIVGYIELISDFQIEFREDKTLDELEQIANYIDSFSFVGSVTLNIVSNQKVKNYNLAIKTRDDISNCDKIEVENAIENNLIQKGLQNNYKEVIIRKDFAELVASYIEVKKRQIIEEIVKETTNKELSLILETEKFNNTDNESVIYAKVLGILSVGNNNFNSNADIIREQEYMTIYRLFQK